MSNARVKTVKSLLLEMATEFALQPLPAYVMPSMYTLVRSMSVAEGGVSGPGRGEAAASAAQRLRTMAGTENLMVSIRGDIGGNLEAGV